MKAIKITQDIKDKNAKYSLNFVNNNAVGTIVKRGFPSKFHVTEPVSGGYANRTDLHEADGWQDVIIPSYNSSTQKLGSTVIEVEGVFTYEVIDKTEQEIQNQLLSASEATKEQRIKEISDALILEETYNETDIETILDNLDLYPTFEVGIEVKNEADSPSGIPYRCKDFNNENELVLWECIQSHTTQADWKPKDVPALFKRVALDGEIPVFVQPTGSHDAYQTGDKVHFPTINDPVYESLIDGNVWSPLTYPAGWQIVN